MKLVNEFINSLAKCLLRSHTEELKSYFLIAVKNAD